ncbi:DUF7706 family protein [Tepidimonas charontis]|jgi:hypothetical protein|uniref:Uncharacterized protein n=3 Tax=Tepidimonas TaxID=114248 RepID=A0A554WZG4_9BURK|nr:hypothetical protein [Tepidimonas charontis]MDW8319611.1 hypothetical protein [Anaerolineae bacterium]TSE26664.1 hypothetical protein Tther_02567 [Tepidimonas thermarum]TSE28973.1 hypothetical protein Tchar_02636 [Tepidimonas charontis]
MNDQVEVWMVLEPAQALALAQFVKRVRWTEVRQNAVGDDEADLMMDAMRELAKALAEAGYAPR